MATKPDRKKTKEKTPVPTAKKKRKEPSVTINQEAADVLEAAKKHGRKKVDFASAAIIAYATELGDAMPLSPATVLEARLDYLEQYVSLMQWCDMCENDSKRAGNLKRLVGKVNHSPYSRDFKKLDKRREDKGKGSVIDTEWITAAFAEKFEFDCAPEVSDPDDFD